MSLTSTNATNSGRSNYTNSNNNLVGVGVASFSSSNTPFSTSPVSNRHQYCNMIATNSSSTSANQTQSAPSASMHSHSHHQHNHLPPHSQVGASLSSNQAVNAPNGISSAAIALASSSSPSLQFDPTSSSLSTSSTNLSMLGNSNQTNGLQTTTNQIQILTNIAATNNNVNNNANNSNINNHMSLQHSHQYHHNHSTQHLNHNHQANGHQMTSFSNSSTHSAQVISSTPSPNSNSSVSSLPISILANSHMQTSASLTNNNNYSFSSVSSSPHSTSLTQHQTHTQPSTSAISSSSTSSSNLNASNNAQSSSSDWFSYVYKIDNIEELIRSNETQQSFVQSPIFSFTHHVINANANSNSNANGVHTSSVSTQSSTTTNEVNTAANKSASNISTTSSKQPSNWRLIFYPNGAGTDCKNFLSIFLKYLSDEPVKIQMMFSIVNNNNEDVYVKYTVNKFNKSNDWGFKQLIHKNAILFQKEKFLKAIKSNGSNKGSLNVRVKMRLDDYKHDYIKKLNDNLHYCKLLSENFSQYYYNNNNNSINNMNASNNNVSLNNETASNGPTSTDLGNNNQTSMVAMPSTSSLPSSTSSLTQSNHTKNVQTCCASNFSSYNVCTSSNSSPFQKLNTSSSHEILNSSSNSHFYDISLLIKKSASYTNEPCSSASNFNSNCNSSEYSNESNKLKRSLIIDSSDCQTTNKKVKLTHQSDAQQLNDSLEQINNEHQDEFIEIRAHKFILAARSPVFKAMFNYRLKENLTNKLVIEDSRPEVIDALIKYIYTAHLPDETIQNIAIDLYIAAEKYLIESLKFKCRESLVENLNVNSVLQTYILAEMYNDSMLRKQSLKFISENIDKVTKNADWNDLVITYPQHFTNAFIRLCKKDF